MKKLKLGKKSALYGVTVLLVAAIAVLAVSLTNVGRDLESTKEALAVQTEEVERLKLEVKTVQAGNGTSLDKCLNKAAKAYSNWVKTNGRIDPNNEKVTYFSDLKDWEKANEQLGADRKKCNETFK